VEGGQWILQCTGDDPGLAINSLPAMADAGPYTLEFRLLSRAGGAGEIFWTTDAVTTLPRGGHLEYPVRHDGEWQTVKLVIPEVKRLFALRLDPCAGPGEVRLEQVRLRDAQGRVVQAWP
jgi:hypothetical protein